MLSYAVGLKINFRAKNCGKFLVDTVSFFTKKMKISEVFSEIWIVGIVVLATITLTDVAPKMILTEVNVQLIIVKETFITKFTARMPLV